MRHRIPQLVLIVAALLGAWLGMQAMHEAGHVLGAWCSGGSVKQVVLHPLTISRTDLADNPHPLLVVWAGPLFGCMLPLALWLTMWSARLPGAYLTRFFAGFCLIANGAYIGGGSFERVGDCGEMLRHGAPMWSLWLFGVVAVPVGISLWHRLGPAFGLGAARGHVSPGAVCVALVFALALLVLGLVVGD
ncbi:MAG: hypothetical protein FJ271_25775 [Planctomycetes bacterium]|nr:hypothetical protein [Planctomycetota bacterium]